ncbi:MAG: hypothetical protein CMJ26_05500 [Phycisphaerae bacterium]|nr:hypothetical protein [Phycisphaerae bacterium]
MSRTLYVCNGPVLTQVSPPSFSRSLSIVDGRISEIDAEQPKNAEVLDLGGCVLVPGFVDSHLHLVQGACGMGEVDLREVNSKEEFRRVLLAAEKDVKQGNWLIAHGWTQETLGAMPNVDWFPEELTAPVLCYRVDFHSAIVNTVALKLIPEQSVRAVAGGDEFSKGIVKEDALYSVVCPLIPELSSSQKIARTTKKLDEMQTLGITLVGTMEDLADVEDVLQQIPLQDHMRIRVMCLDDANKENADRCSVASSNSLLKVTGFKAFLDGSLGSRTAKMYEPWNDTSGSGVWAGIGASGTVSSWTKHVVSLGFSPVLHAIGDEAVGAALHAFRNICSHGCPRIEHAQFIAEHDIQQVETVMFGVQPLHQPDDKRIAESAVGKERAAQLHNWRRMLDAGAILSFGSDWPVAEANPIAAMRVAISNGVTAEEALEASTSAACASLDRSLTGKLSVGSYADMVVLDCNPLQCDWEQTQPKVIMTFLAGKRVYTKDTE